MRIWSADYTASVEITPTETYFTTDTDAECLMTVQTGTISGLCFAWVRRADLVRVVEELDFLDLSREGCVTLPGRDPLGEITCTLSVKAVDRSGHLRLTVDLVHRDPGDGHDHRVSTGFSLDPSSLPGVRKELGQLADTLFSPGTALHREPADAPKPLDPSWPGLEWRFLAKDWQNPGRHRFHLTGDGRSWFDELVVGQWLHVEWMNGRNWWLRVGDASISVAVPSGADPIVMIERDCYYQRLPEGEAQAILSKMDDNDDPYPDRPDDL